MPACVETSVRRDCGRKTKNKFGERRILKEGSINSLMASSLGKHFDWYYGTHYSMPLNLMLRMGKYV